MRRVRAHVSGRLALDGDARRHRRAYVLPQRLWSFDQGLELVRRGSVAGAVTLANVLNPEASRVGMTFARLVMHGYSVSQALSLPRLQSLTNKFYSVVGDGSHRLVRGEVTYPIELTASRVSVSEFELQFGFPQLNIPGGVAKPRLPPDADYVLRGRPSSLVLDRAAFGDFLASVNSPVIYENEFYWTTELADRLAASPPPRPRRRSPIKITGKPTTIK